MAGKVTLLRCPECKVRISMEDFLCPRCKNIKALRDKHGVSSEVPISHQEDIAAWRKKVYRWI